MVFLYRFRWQAMKKLNSYISSADMKEKGRAAYYKMLESVRQGELIQIRWGLYANIDQLSNSMIDIEVIIPGGILCSWSAWIIHQLTTTMPQAYHIAIKRDWKVVTPSFPSIELHHYTASILEIGVSKMFLEGYNNQDLRHRTMRMWCH